MYGKRSQNTASCFGYSAQGKGSCRSRAEGQSHTIRKSWQILSSRTTKRGGTTLESSVSGNTWHQRSLGTLRFQGPGCTPL
eukprot:8145839-Karenia_brevis.AAC.1